MPVQKTTVEVTADCEARVARGDAGSLNAGVEALFAEADAVRECELRSVGSVRPDAFDLYVDVTVELALALPEGGEADESAARDALADVFGVCEVRRVRIDPGE
ncbi:MAG: hypothetical protein ABEI11_00690 [Haloarculaceae archaeon]